MRAYELTIKTRSGLGKVSALLIAFLFPLLFVCPLFADVGQPSETVVLNNAIQKIPLSPLIAYGFEQDEALSVDEVESQIEWQHTDREGELNLGFGAKPVWLKLEVQQEEELTSNWQLAILYHALNYIDYYVFSEGKLIQRVNTGAALPFEERYESNRIFVFPIPHRKSLTLYLRVEATAITYLPIYLMDDESLVNFDRTNIYLNGLYVGVIVAMVIYNLFLFSAIRERIYLDYVAYVIWYFLFMLSITGYGFQLLWPQYPGFNVMAPPLFGAISAYLSLAFTRRFIQPNLYAPFLVKPFRVYEFSYLIIAGAVLLIHYDFNLLLNELSLLLTTFIIGSTFYCFLKGNKQAKFFLAAWLCFLLGLAIFACTLNGLLPANFFTIYSVQMGSIGEVLIFSFALANRINTEKEEKSFVIKMQQQSVHGLMLAEQEIYDIAFKDKLTGLPNREQLARNVNRCKQEESELTLYLIIMHLNQIKEINKAFGYKAGDDLLKKVAIDLKEKSEAWARHFELSIEFNPEKDLGTSDGVNFILVVRAINVAAVEKMCKLILTYFDQPIQYLDMSIDMGACIGFAPCNKQINEFDDLLKNAQVAVESAMTHSLGYVCYREELDADSQKRIMLMGDLKRAIQEESLQLYLQPKVQLSTDSVVGFEALLRWQHPKHGFIPPDEFIALAERSGVIRELTDWVLRRALSHLQFFNQHQLYPHISINVSAKNLCQANFAEQVIQAIAEYEVDCKDVILEITETSMMDDPDRALACLLQFQHHHVGISLDDFGTGFSSLSYLSRLPLHEIKIDRTFINEIELQDKPVIVETTLRMARAMHLSSVAEGIESLEALNCVKAMGCDLAQGYFIARPQPMNELLTWLAEQPGFEVLKDAPQTSAKKMGAGKQIT